jgi:hypothetical protein
MQTVVIVADIDVTHEPQTAVTPHLHTIAETTSITIHPTDPVVTLIIVLELPLPTIQGTVTTSRVRLQGLQGLQVHSTGIIT